MSKLVRQRHLQAALQKTKAYIAQQTARLAQAAAADLEKQGLCPCTHQKTGTVHALSAAENAKNLRFVATADFAGGDTFTLNGRPIAAGTLSGEGLFPGYFKKGAAAVCQKEGEHLTFGTPGPQALCRQLLDAFYPVGTLYQTLDAAFDPNRAFGGQWQLVAEGAAPRQAGSQNGARPVGTVYGEAAHALGVAEMPRHTHDLDLTRKNGPKESISVIFGSSDGGTATREVYMGVSQTVQNYDNWVARLRTAGESRPHNNVGPSLAVNIWQRKK